MRRSSAEINMVKGSSEAASNDFCQGLDSYLALNAV
jgi:hypothetical protein